MSLINYIEPANIGSILVGLGTFFATLLFIYIIWRFAKPIIAWLENMYHSDLKYSIIQDKFLEDIAKEKGVDLDAEFLKRKIIEKEPRNMRAKIEEEVFNRMFPESVETKNKK